MTKLRILISDSVSELCVSRLRASELEVTYQPGIAHEELMEKISAYQGLIVRSGTHVTSDVIAHGTKLKVIGRAGVGVDNIDVGEATKRGVAVVNAPGANTVAVAEHTMALMLALVRQIPKADFSLSNGEWLKSALKGSELFGKTLGLIGLGKIGTAVAQRAKAFSMNVVAFDPLVPSTAFFTIGVIETDLPSLLRQSDFISIHAPLTNQTRNLINDEALSMCKPNLRLINTSRGGIVDEHALCAALENGQIAGAALDVFENEPPGPHPLFSLDNVVATPHLGASTQESQDRVAEEIAEIVAAFLAQPNPKNLLNPDVLGDLEPRT